MRIGSAVVDGTERVVADDGTGVFAAPPSLTMVQAITDWDTWGACLAGLAATDAERIDPETLRWLPPLIPEKLICVGTNYSDHVAEMEAAGGPKAPGNPWPFGFFKPPRTTLTGHGATVRLPGFAEKVDWEAELAVIIGDPAKIKGSEPLDAVFGYSVLNDISVRDYFPLPHALGLDAVVCKGFDGSAPMGPWIVTADQVTDPQDLRVRLTVNGVVKQDSSTSSMIFGVREILRHFGRVLTLLPGDVIATGTPAGVGIARRPPETLADGDIIEAEIDGICRLRTAIAPAPQGTLLTA